MDHYLAKALMNADQSTVALFIQTERWVRMSWRYYPNAVVKEEAMNHIWLGAK
jgi:hypothetical protein